MEAIIADSQNKNTWDGGGKKPFDSSYGKMMMWFFIMSDALTFSGFLGAYGLMRFKFLDSWPIADEVFTHIPFIHGNFPMYYVAFMTFVLIFSSVTMVLAVDAGISNSGSIAQDPRRDTSNWLCYDNILAARYSVRGL